MRAISVIRGVMILICIGATTYSIVKLNPADITYCLLNAVSFLTAYTVICNIEDEKAGIVKDKRKKKKEKGGSKNASGNNSI